MNATYDVPHSDTEALNGLLCGEMAAVETYTQAMGLFDDELVIADLQKIRDDHSRSVRELRDLVVQNGGTPLEGTGPWGMFAAPFKQPNSIGPATTLAALSRGEEESASEYEAALENPEVPPDSHPVIRTNLLTACHKHVDELNRLLGGKNR